MIHLVSVRAAACLVTVSMALCATLAVAQTPADPANEAADRGWPRLFEAQGHKVHVYAPQLDAWPKFDHITFRAAISVGANDGNADTYGILRVSADTKVAFDDRLVVLTNRKVEELTFSGVEPAEADRLRGIVMAAMPPERPQTVSLDRLIAALKLSDVAVRKVNVNTTPPTIVYSDKPAIMVIFMGKARFKPVPGNDLMFAINTNWDVFLDPSGGQYYLRDGKSWFVTLDLDKGPWMAAASLPASLSSLPQDENWADVLAAIPGEPAQSVPTIYVAHEPQQLIVAEGGPELEVVPGTKLMVVANSDSTLYFDGTAKTYYYLAAGRWFSAAALGGPWRAASDALPDDFKKIPDDGSVLAAVPGTTQASDAVIMASIPQKATIQRADAKLDVMYDGPPRFEPIAPTAVQCATNSPYSVFLVDDGYYCCSNAVWFMATGPNGPWSVCDSVPPAIYTIPPSSPKYNVTYVNVYGSDETTVETGYTAGYSGAIVAGTGVVMFGLGYLVAEAAEDDDDCCWAYRYNPSYYSYGCGAVWHGGYGGYVCAESYYGPYGGAGHAAAYNAATGVYSRAGYVYGPAGAAGYRTAYNPATGVAAGRAGGVTPYGSWGRSAVTHGDQWVRGGHETTARGTVAGVQGSGGAAAVTAQGRFGNGATVAKTQSGDYYAAHDGNVYKKSGDDWQQANNRPYGVAATENRPTAQPPQQTFGELNQSFEDRNRGEFNTQRANEFNGGGGWGGGRFGGGGRRGGRR